MGETQCALTINLTDNFEIQKRPSMGLISETKCRVSAMTFDRFRSYRFYRSNRIGFLAVSGRRIVGVPLST